MTVGKRELIDKILADARLRAEAILQEADHEVQLIHRRLEEAKKRLEIETEEKIRLRVNSILENARSRGELEAKKMILAAKWRLIEKLKERIRTEVVNSPEYPILLKRLAIKYGGPDTKVHLSPADKDRYGNQMEIELGEPVAISGGMLIRREREEVDLSLETLLDRVIEENITAISEIVFPSSPVP